MTSTTPRYSSIKDPGLRIAFTAYSHIRFVATLFVCISSRSTVHDLVLQSALVPSFFKRLWPRIHQSIPLHVVPPLFRASRDCLTSHVVQTTLRGTPPPVTIVLPSTAVTSQRKEQSLQLPRPALSPTASQQLAMHVAVAENTMAMSAPGAAAALFFCLSRMPKSDSVRRPAAAGKHGCRRAPR